MLKKQNRKSFHTTFIGLLEYFRFRCFHPSFIRKEFTFSHFNYLLKPLIKHSNEYIFFLSFYSSVQKFDHFSQPTQGYGTVSGDMDSPGSFDEVERPPLRHIDKYVRAELGNMTARYTVSILTCVGFIISFGMRCNLGMAKLKREKDVSHIHIYD